MESAPDPDSTPVTRALQKMGVPHRFFRHPNPVRSFEQAAAERGQRPSQIVRSLVFRLSGGEFIMVLVAGPQQISWPALRAYLGQSRVTMASAEEVLEVTGYPTGAVSPIGLPAPMRLLVDRSLLAEAEISIGSGVHSTTIILKTADLLPALPAYELGDFSQAG